MKEASRHLEAFEAWYESGRNYTKASSLLTVTRASLYQWADKFNWHERADARDQNAQQIADEEAAQEKAKRAKKRRQAAELMTARGVEFFTKNEIDNAGAAIQAIKNGLENERKEDGVPDWVLMILNANTDDLETMAKSLGVALTSAEAESGDDGSFSLESGAEEE